jgi:hypothetical protein
MQRVEGGAQKPLNPKQRKDVGEVEEYFAVIHGCRHEFRRYGNRKSFNRYSDELVAS